MRYLPFRRTAIPSRSPSLPLRGIRRSRGQDALPAFQADRHPFPFSFSAPTGHSSEQGSGCVTCLSGGPPSLPIHRRTSACLRKCRIHRRLETGTHHLGIPLPGEISGDLLGTGHHSKIIRTESSLSDLVLNLSGSLLPVKASRTHRSRRGAPSCLMRQSC